MNLCREDLKALLDEINRIITAPYVVSLQPLQKIVQRLKGDELKTWASLKPCQIPKLVSYLVKSVDWDNGLVPLIDFARVNDIGEALLRHKNLLPQLLKLSADESKLVSVTPLCLEIMKAKISPANPTSIHIIPKHLPQFLQKLVEEFNKYPKGESFRQVRTVVAAYSPDLLEEIPEDILEKFINKCKVTMQRSSDHEDLLNCVDIARLVYETYNFKEMSDRFSCLEELETHSRSLMHQWYRKVTSWFKNDKVGNNILMTMCRLIFYLSMKEDVALAKRIEMVNIGSGILYQIEKQTLQEWCTKDPIYLQKLWRTAAREDVPTELKLVIFGRCIRANPSAQNIEEIGNIVLSVLHTFTKNPDGIPLCSLPQSCAYTTYITNALHLMLKSGIHVCEQIMLDIMYFLTRYCEQDVPLTLEEVNNIRNALVLVDALRHTFDKHPEVAQLAVKASRSVRRPILNSCDKFKPAEMPPVNCGSESICPSNFQRLKIKLGLEFSFLMLEAASVGPEYIEYFNDHRELIENSRSLPNSGCLLTVPTTKECHFPNIEVFQKPERSHKDFDMSMDWKQMLEKDLGEASKAVHDLAVHHMEGVFQDLERRCETVEEPLLAAINQLELANLDLDMMTDRCATITSLNDHLGYTNKSLNEQVLKLKTTLECFEIQRDVAWKKANELEAELKSAVADCKKAVTERDATVMQLGAADAAKDAVRDAAMFSLQEKCHDQEQRATKLEVDVNWLTAQIETQRHEMDATHIHEIEHLHSRLNDLQEATFTVQAELDSRTEEVERITIINLANVQRLQTKEKTILGFSKSEKEWVVEKEALKSDLQKKAEESKRLGEIIESNREEAETKDEIIETLTGASLEWTAEKEHLQSELKAARKREKQVLAAIQGGLTSTQASTASPSGAFKP